MVMGASWCLRNVGGDHLGHLDESHNELPSQGLGDKERQRNSHKINYLRHSIQNGLEQKNNIGTLISPTREIL